MGGTKRAFSNDDKNRMVREAEAQGFTSIAKKYSVAPGQLYTWRKRSRAVPPPETKPTASIMEELRQSAAKVYRLEELQRLSLEKTIADIAAGKISAYNASTALTNIVNSNIKLEEKKQEVLDRLRHFEKKEAQGSL